LNKGEKALKIRKNSQYNKTQGKPSAFVVVPLRHSRLNVLVLITMGAVQQKLSVEDHLFSFK
jgi:hypothetical protein